MNYSPWMEKILEKIPRIGFASKLYVAGLIATTFVFVSTTFAWFYFYEQTENSHQISIEAKTVRLDLLEVQTQAYAFYSSNNDIHLQIHQHALQELSSNLEQLSHHIQQMNVWNVESAADIHQLKQLTSTMQHDVSVYKIHFYDRLLEFRDFEKLLRGLQDDLLQTWQDFDRQVVQLKQPALVQAWLRLRQYEQQHTWLFDKNSPESDQALEVVITQMQRVESNIHNIGHRPTRTALRNTLQQHRMAYQHKHQLEKTFAKNHMLTATEAELSSIGLDTYDIEDVMNNIITQVQTQLLYFAWAMLALFIVLAVLVNRLLSKILTRPLVALANSARHVGAGDLDRKIEVFSNDEVGALGEAFNRMVDNIRVSREALIASEQYEAKQIMASMGEGLLVLDHDHVLIKVNPALSKLLKYSEQELLGMPFSGLLDDHEIETFFDKDGSTVTPIKCKDGALLPAMISGSPILDESERYTGAVLVVSDMRQYLALQADKEQAEKSLETEQHQRLESLGLMAGGIAHDFNNLLTPIICNSELLLKTVDEGSKPHHYIQQTLDAANHASRLSKQMLSYSGSGRLASETITLQAFISNMKEVLQSTAHEKVLVHLDINHPLPCLDADVTELEQILLNLVINASDALHEQAGDVIIATKEQHIDQAYLAMQHTYSQPNTAVGEYVAFTVQDFGCGMSEEVQRKLFDPFFTTKFTGRGLGMSAVLGIVYSHHGVLHVDSTEGEGTIFTVSFPISKQRARVQIAPDLPAPSNARDTFQGHLLIVDDEEAVIEVLEGLLESLGCTTTLAYDGLQAVEIYKEHQHTIDAVILDMTMPVMSGAICFKKLLEINPDVKVVLSSGYAQVDLKEQLPLEALADYLQKPYNTQDLIDVLCVVLDE